MGVIFNIRRATIVVVILFGIILPTVAGAVDWLPLVPCGLNARPADGDPNTNYTQPCNRCELLHLLRNLIFAVMLGVVPLGGTLLFVIAGFLWILGGANPGYVSQAKSIFTNTFYAILVIALAWIIVNTIIKSIAKDEIFANQPWYKFACTATVPTQTGVPTQTPAPTGPGGTCPASGQNLCQGTQTTCGNSNCAQYAASIGRYAGGSANLLKAIMVNESSCNIAAQSRAGAFGLMQLLPSTANAFKSECEVSENITGAWLTNPANADKSICIAAAYVRSLAGGACGSSPQNVAAGYNGGSGACEQSVSCRGDTSCSGGPTRKWECVYDNPEKTACNVGYEETRRYAPKVAYCTQNPGF